MVKKLIYDKFAEHYEYVYKIVDLECMKRAHLNIQIQWSPNVSSSISKIDSEYTLEVYRRIDGTTTYLHIGDYLRYDGDNPDKLIGFYTADFYKESEHILKNAVYTKAYLYEHLAEECSELAHAALKFARKMRGENPTPETKDDLEENLIEEAIDVRICCDFLGLDKCHISEWNSLYDRKINRWKERLKENEE